MFLPLECLSVFEWRPVSDVETLRSDAVVSSDRPRVGLAVVGAGYWGPNLARNAQKTPGLKLEYLCDLDVARARTVMGEYSTVRIVGSFDEVLADPAVEAVAIATPAATHYGVAMAALEAGKHV